MTAETLEATLPLPVEATGSTHVEELTGLAAEKRELFERRLLVHGALLFRGWRVDTLDAFRRFVTAFSGTDRLFDYAGGASPRSALGQKSGVYSSTDYPPHVPLSLHNELSYADLYPKRLFFLCLTPPDTGGETTLGDSRRILTRIGGRVVDAFRSKKIRYIRNLSSDVGSGYSWQEAFATSDREVAEARCREIGSDYEWRGSVLRMSQVRPATAVHPATGEEVWFNQADGFHPSVLDPESYRAALAYAGSEDLFRLNVSYGDGTAIERQDLEHIRAVIREETIPHRWRAGDVLVIDNLLAAHGRFPFSGPRKIALAMT